MTIVGSKGETYRTGCSPFGAFDRSQHEASVHFQGLKANLDRRTAIPPAQAAAALLRSPRAVTRAQLLQKLRRIVGRARVAADEQIERRHHERRQHGGEA